MRLKFSSSEKMKKEKKKREKRRKRQNEQGSCSSVLMIDADTYVLGRPVTA